MPWVRLSPTKLTWENQLFSTGAVRGSAAMRKSSAVVVPSRQRLHRERADGRILQRVPGVVLCDLLQDGVLPCLGRVTVPRRFHITLTAPSSTSRNSSPAAIKRRRHRRCSTRRRYS